jgi:glycosyltransferase involved in cell wall biosynthesis
MRKYGYRTALIAPEHSQVFARAKTEGFAVYPVRFGNKGHLPSWLLLMKLMARLKPMVVNTHSSDDSWMAGFAARLSKVPLIIRTRHVSTPIGSTFSYRHFPHLILTTSESIRADLMERGLDGVGIMTVPTGIDPKRFAFSDAWRERIRKSLGMREEEFLVGNVCVLRSWKGLDFLIETAAVMKGPFKFILVGEGPQRKRLEQKVKDMELVDRVLFTGHVENVEEYYSAMDVFLFTSYASEGVPQALLQAMSVGLPIVVCRNASVMETLDGYEDQIAVTYGDLEEAGRALRKMIERHRWSNSVHSARRRLLKTQYTTEKMWNSIAEIYRSKGIAPPDATE